MPIQDAGFPVHLLPMEKPYHFPSVLMKLRALLRERDHDLIHAHLPVTGILARIAGRMQGVPVVYTEHNLQERYHPVTAWMNRATFGMNERVIALSGEVAVSIARKKMDRAVWVTVRRNGIPLEAVQEEAQDAGVLCREFGIPDGCPVVGTIAVFRKHQEAMPGDHLPQPLRV